MNRYFLVVDNGDPHKKGTEIELLMGQTLVGRPWQNYFPDVAFSSPHVSKRHIMINCADTSASIQDLGSKHGTAVNGRILEPGVPLLVSHGDIITLARGAVRLEFCDVFAAEKGETVDLCTLTQNVPRQYGNLLIDPDRREVRLGSEILNLTGKEIELLLLLHERCNQALSYSDIKFRVWPERAVDGENVPDVSAEEISALVYRLRKRLGEFGAKIVNIPRFGYRMDL